MERPARGSATCRPVALRSRSTARRPRNAGLPVDHEKGPKIRSSYPCPDPLLRLAAMVQQQRGFDSTVPCLAGHLAVPRLCSCFAMRGAVRRQTAVQAYCAVPGRCLGATVLPRLRTAARFRRKEAPEDCGAYMLGDSSRMVLRSASGKRMRAGICTACWCKRPCPCSSGCKRFCCRAI